MPLPNSAADKPVAGRALTTYVAANMVIVAQLLSIVPLIVKVIVTQPAAAAAAARVLRM